MKEKAINSNDENEKVEPVKLPDFYMENGLMVLTEAFHLKRGYCCKNGCRHCPYPKEEV